MTLAERAVLRIREEMTERKVSQRARAERLRCSQGRVAKLLNGGINLRLNDIAVVTEALGITVVEALRDRGLEFYAELTPSEVRLLERFRRLPPDERQAYAVVLRIQDGPKAKAPVPRQHTRRALRS